jgi:cellulose synthase/poly-beta-1,6-N-acetylglucosamine synthase-like glycosyltransferase
MKKWILFLFLLGAVFIGSFFAAQKMNQKNGKKEVQVSLQSRFKPTAFPLRNLPFTIVFVAQNNGAYVSKTLSSIFSQNYDNYKVIYIDDKSDDGSFELARELIYDSAHLPKVTLVQNENKLGQLANVFRAVQSCQDQ